MKVTVVHTEGGLVGVQVEDSSGSPMQSIGGTVVPTEGLLVAPGSMVELTITDSRGRDPDLDAVKPGEPLSERNAAAIRRVGDTVDGGSEEYTLLGVPVSQIASITLDGRHWLEVFGTIYVAGIDQPDPFDGPALIFRVAQAPGGKEAKYGIAQGETVVVAPHRVLGFTRKERG